jgi:hypothetical protein
MTVTALVLALLGIASGIAAGVVAYRGRTKLQNHDDGMFTLEVDDGFPWTLLLTIAAAILAGLSSVAGALAALFGI